MAFIRLLFVLIGSGVVILAYEIADGQAGIAAGLAWSTFTIVNLISIGLLVWRTNSAICRSV